MDVDVGANLQRDLSEFERHVDAGTTVQFEFVSKSGLLKRGGARRAPSHFRAERTPPYFADAQRLTISSYGIVTPLGFSLASLAFGPSGLPSHCFGSTGLFSRGPQPP